MTDNSLDIQLGSLDFYGIKNSIVEHLKKQNTLKDYDYEGSAMQVLLDVLAYNTLYYGFYSNMLASEMFLDTAQKDSSIISLVKPLGYVVPGAKSSRATAKILQGGDEDLPIYSRFTGHDGGGVSYNFYTVENYALDTNGESIVEIVEGKTLVKEQPLLIDANTQKGFLLGLDVDISTVRIEVLDSEGDGTWKEWGRASNIEQGLDSTSQVYWLERSDLGFFVVFGGNLENSAYVQVGRQLKANDLVRVSYLKSSGERGNQVGNFSVQNFGATTETVSLSSGGTSKPDLESIRFFAPKWFAAQNRAVTVEDCRALLASEGFVSGSEDPHSKFNVWGGEEMNPPRYGRLFVALSDTAEENPSAATMAIDILEQKTCVTILPEFMDVERYEAEVAGSLYYEPLESPLSENMLLSTALGGISTKYTNGFKRKYDTGEIANHINSLDDAFYVSPSDITIKLYYDAIASASSERPKGIKFRSSCVAGSLTTTEFRAGSTYIASIENDNKMISLRTSGNVSSKGKQNINAYYFWNTLEVNLGTVGYFIPSTGEVVFTKHIASENFKVSVEVDSTGTQTFNAKEEMYAITKTNLNIIRRNVG
jgi:hypothetical protein